MDISFVEFLIVYFWVVFFPLFTSILSPNYSSHVSTSHVRLLSGLFPFVWPAFPPLFFPFSREFPPDGSRLEFRLKSEVRGGGTVKNISWRVCEYISCVSPRFSWGYWGGFRFLRNSPPMINPVLRCAKRLLASCEMFEGLLLGSLFAFCRFAKFPGAICAFLQLLLVNRMLFHFESCLAWQGFRRCFLGMV